MFLWVEYLDGISVVCSTAKDQLPYAYEPRPDLQVVCSVTKWGSQKQKSLRTERETPPAERRPGSQPRPHVICEAQPSGPNFVCDHDAEGTIARYVFWFWLSFSHCDRSFRQRSGQQFFCPHCALFFVHGVSCATVCLIWNSNISSAWGWCSPTVCLSVFSIHTR